MELCVAQELVQAALMYSAVKKAKKLKQQKMCEDCGLRRSNYALPEEGEPASVLCQVGCGCAHHLIRIWSDELPGRSQV